MQEAAVLFAKLQRLLREGDFVSTYKFAVLVALCRWALEHPQHPEGEPIAPIELAPHVLELYWPQVQPFGVAAGGLAVAERPPRYVRGFVGRASGVLQQERGEQPMRLFALLGELQAEFPLLHAVPSMRRERLLQEIARHLLAMPLPKLHTLRDGRMPFLYRLIDGDGGAKGRSRCIQFEPGVVGWLAAYALLIEDAVRSAWLRFVLRCNAGLLGAAAEVEAFLFPDGRSSLARWREAIAPVQGDACFYCEKVMRDAAVVDHFLPWSRFRRDLGHNFVLAHGGCNERKRDHLASERLLARWCERNEKDGAALAERCAALRLPCDLPTVRHVAWSLYAIAAAAGGRGWDGAGGLVALRGDWQRLLGA